MDWNKKIWNKELDEEGDEEGLEWKKEDEEGILFQFFLFFYFNSNDLMFF